MPEDNQNIPEEQSLNIEAHESAGPVVPNHEDGPEIQQAILREEQAGSRFSGLGRFLLDLAETLVLSLVLFLVINAVIARIRVESISMEPTLYRGEFIVVNKVVNITGGFKRGNVIVFKYPNDPNQQYIKRIIGFPGEKVQIADGKVVVNGNPLVEPYIMDPPTYSGEWVVPADSFFVLGDNRNRSSDSHVWGMVPFKDIVGKALFIYWPFYRMGTIPGLPNS